MRYRTDKISSEDVREWKEKMRQEEYLSNITFPKKPTSDGYYHVYVPDETKKSGRRAVKAKTLEDLKAKVYKILRGPEPTFKYVFNLTQEHKLDYIKDEEKRLSTENTIKKTDDTYKRFFSGTDFENIPVEDMTKQDVEEICLFNLRRYNLKRKGFMNLRSILRATFKYAYEQYWMLDDLYSRIDFKKFNTMLVRDTPIEHRAHTSKELELMREYIRKYQQDKPNYMPSYALELQMIMGLRIGEVSPLCWEDVTDEYICIRKEQIVVRANRNITTSYSKIVNHTKTWKDRYYPRTREIDRVLSNIRSRSGSTGYLFKDHTDTGVISNKSIYQFYYRMCKYLGIELSKEFRKGTHSFRRNAITEVVNNSGGNFALAAELFGNSPQVAHANYYTGINISEARKVLEA